MIGLGAIGASYAAKLSAARGVDLVVIAEGERAVHLERDGVVVNDQRFDLSVVRPDEPVEPADLVIVAVKGPALAEAIAQIAGHVGPGTILLSLLNGITSEDELAAAYPQATVLYAIAVGIDAVREGNRISYAQAGKTVFGEAANVAPYAPAVRWLADLFEAAGLAYEIPADMIHQLWWKFMVNDGVNQVTALLRAPYAAVQTAGSPAWETMLAAQREVVAVARALGIDLGEADLASWFGVLATLGPDRYTSMAQDARAGRVTEADMFGGLVRRLGEQTGVPVPVNTVLHQLLLAQTELATGAGRTPPQ